MTHKTGPATLIFEVEIVNVDRLNRNHAKWIGLSTGELSLLPIFEVHHDFCDTLRLLQVS